MKKITILFFLLSVKIITAQNFNYTLTKDSAGYSPLASATVLAASGNDWSRHQPFTVQLPFHFPLGGSLFTDSVSVENNGYIVLDKGRNIAVAAFNSFGCRKDTLNHFVSQLSTTTITGGSGRTVIIEFKNVAQNRLSSFDHLSYQTWINENGSIEFHIGENPYTAIAATDTVTHASQTPALMGIINRNMDTSDKAFLISGNPFSPVGNVISSNPDLLYISNIPSNGDVYILNP